MLDLNYKPPRPGLLDFKRIAQIALAEAFSLVPRWLPDGRRHGTEWVARNPKRADRHMGSFRISLRTGRWADFATGDAGGDLIALRAFLDDIKQAQAARRIIKELAL